MSTYPSPKHHLHQTLTGLGEDYRWFNPQDRVIAAAYAQGVLDGLQDQFETETVKAVWSYLGTILNLNKM